MDQITPPQNGKPVLSVKNLVKHFPVKKSFLSTKREAVQAVNGISFSLAKGETLGLVGESGCGKTTVGRLIVRLDTPDKGEIYYNDSPNLAALPEKEMLSFRRNIQMIFQDPFSSLNPRMSVGSIVGEPLAIHHLAKGKERRERIGRLLRDVGLQPEHSVRFPHEFSGGQRQRISIARALAVEPDIVIADEPVSALDVSIQAQIINLLLDLQKNFEISMIFISHDLSVVGHISHRIAVMYLGAFMEVGSRDQVLFDPLHPYTRALLSAIPTVDPGTTRKRIILEGDVPSPIHPPPGCPFHPRCSERFDPCDKAAPPLVEFEDGRKVACFLYKDSTGK